MRAIADSETQTASPAHSVAAPGPAPSNRVGVSPRFVAGLDIGSTGIKVLVADETGREVLIQQRPTPWCARPGGGTEIKAEALLATLIELLAATSAQLSSALGQADPVVEAIAVSGMGETGLLVDAEGAVAAPAFAWFDPRGQEQVDALPADIRRDFAGRTGLPVGVQVSVVKLLHWRDAGQPLAGLRWFNLPEYVVSALGGREVSEYSLTSRTGLLDQDSGERWGRMLEYLRVDADFLPPLVEAGTDLGAAAAQWLPSMFAGARLTVAGHDHLVSAEARGPIPDNRYHVSMGTAEVLLRVLDRPLGFEARTRLADRLINEVRHVVPGKHVLVAGVKTGLLMRRALQLVGISDRAGRDRLDTEVMALPYEGALADGGINVHGARNDDGVLSLTIPVDGATPAELFGAILRHGNDEIQLLIEAINRELPPATSAVLTGGWADMACVQRARSVVLRGLAVSERAQETAFGAAQVAARLLPPASDARS